MKINKLFEKIQDELSPEELNGELTLQGNCIVWTYNLNDVGEDIEISDDDDEQEFSFESVSSEEILREAYQEDLEYIQEILDEFEESDNWSISEPDISENIISFKLF